MSSNEENDADWSFLRFVVFDSPAPQEARVYEDRCKAIVHNVKPDHAVVVSVSSTFIDRGIESVDIRVAKNLH